VHARTWYFRLLLKRTIAGVIVGTQSLSGIRSPEQQALGLCAMGPALGAEASVLLTVRRVGPIPMSSPGTSTPRAGTPEDPDEVHAAGLEVLIARLVARQASGQVGYWAVYLDDRGVSHCALTTDPAYADLSPENAARRTGAVAAISRAIERYRAALADLGPPPASSRPAAARRGAGEPMTRGAGSSGGRQR